ncbi:hypothetical protein [Lactococcus lactis]|nr:hypothetical protein [Lactococcus lactis]MCO0830502.1 hypothetical protein [Lactococcus lactis]
MRTYLNRIGFIGSEFASGIRQLTHALSGHQLASSILVENISDSENNFP